MRLQVLTFRSPKRPVCEFCFSCLPLLSTYIFIVPTSIFIFIEKICRRYPLFEDYIKVTLDNFTISFGTMIVDDIHRTGDDDMTTLYFVRHAHSTYTTDEWARPLSEKGEGDVPHITNILSEEAIDLVVSSPYKRAIQTVQGIADQIETEVLLIDALRERTLTTEPAEDFTLAMTKVWEDPKFAWEGGESNVDAQQRGVGAIQALLDQHEGKRIGIGTHGNIMVLILNYFDEQYGYSFWKELDMPDIYKVTFDKHELVNVEKLWDRQKVV